MLETCDLRIRVHLVNRNISEIFIYIYCYELKFYILEHIIYYLNCVSCSPLQVIGLGGGVIVRNASVSSE